MKWLTASEKPGLQVRIARISDMLPLRSNSKWLTASEKPGLQVRIARISDMACPRRRCEIPFEFHSMRGCGMEQHDLMSWRTELLICQAFALEEHVKVV